MIQGIMNQTLLAIFNRQGGFFSNRGQQPVSMLKKMENQTKKQIMSAEDMRRAITRIAHEIVERHRGVKTLVFAGIHTRGFPLAHRLAKMIELFEGKHLPVYALDISLYRDDVPSKVRPLAKPSNFSGDIAGREDTMLYPNVHAV